MARNTHFLQIQADLLGIPVLQLSQSEGTALGAAFLAGLQLGLWSGLADLRRLIEPGQRF